MSQARRGGFTLVELLVVIGIIALLIAILLPSLSRARAAANVISCGSQMRQIYTFYAMYALDNRGMYPALSGYYGWTGQVASDFDQERDGVEVIQRYQQSRDVATATKQQLWLCPSDFEKDHKALDPANWDGGRDMRQVSYGENRTAWFGAQPQYTGPWQNDNRSYRAIKPTRIRSKYFGNAEIVMMAERRSIGPVFYQNQTWQNSKIVEGGRTTDTYDSLLFRHYNDFSVMNVLYLDGHVSTVNYKDCQDAFRSLLTWPDPFH